MKTTQHFDFQIFLDGILIEGDIGIYGMVLVVLAYFSYGIFLEKLQNTLYLNLSANEEIL
jgi:hypothetical protein